jgi:hypothetical protein
LGVYVNVAPTIVTVPFKGVEVLVTLVAIAPAETELVMLGAIPAVAEVVQGEVAQKVTFGETVTAPTIGVGGLPTVIVIVAGLDVPP